MSDLAAWLLAQIAERAANARNIHDRYCGDLGEMQFFGITPGTASPSSIVFGRAAWSEGTDRECDCGEPARVLADCEAKRKIVGLHRPVGRGDFGDTIACLTCGEVGCCFVRWPCQTLRLLALPYADRPGYDPAWGIE